MDLRVLVVCPDQDSATLLGQVLGEMELAVEHTPSISQGAERLRDEIFDAVILDYRADQSSEEFLAKLRQTHTKSRKTLLIASLALAGLSRHETAKAGKIERASCDD